jgi:hypothetical protein
MNQRHWAKADEVISVAPNTGRVPLGNGLFEAYRKFGELTGVELSSKSYRIELEDAI